MQKPEILVYPQLSIFLEGFQIPHSTSQLFSLRLRVFAVKLFCLFLAARLSVHLHSAAYPLGHKQKQTCLQPKEKGGRSPLDLIIYKSNTFHAENTPAGNGGKQRDTIDSHKRSLSSYPPRLPRARRGILRVMNWGENREKLKETRGGIIISLLE